MNKKTVLKVLGVISISALMIGCSKPDFSSKINTNVNVNGKPVIEFQHETGSNKIEEKSNQIVEEAPHFSSFKVYCGNKDITSQVNQERIEQVVYATYTNENFFEGCLDQMAGEFDLDKMPEGKIQIVAKYDPAVTVGLTDIDYVLIVPDTLHEDSYFFVVNGCCTFASDVTMKALTEACGL